MEYGMNAPATTRRFWTAEDERLLAGLYPDTPMHVIVEQLQRSEAAIYGKVYLMGLKRSDAFLAGPFAGRIRPGAVLGGGTRFEKGHASWNKGMKGWQPPGCKESQFKPGHLSGKAAELLQPLGTERITKDGIRQRKVVEGGPPQRRWKAVHALMWEEVNGPVPPGHLVVFRDGNKQRIELDNLELITRAENMRRNTIHRYPPELKDVIRLQKKLERTIRKRRDEESDDRSA